MPAPQHAPGYRPDIDGLRAVAVLLVLVYHVSPGLLAGGFIGVDVFFVISGFLITGVIAGALEADTFSLWAFYQRRVRRIFPALSLMLLSSLALGYYLLPPLEYAMLGKHIAAGALFVPNFVYWGEVGYFDPHPQAKGMLHLWSVGIEEQFYLVWPTLLLMFGARVRLYTALCALGSFGVGLMLLRSDPAGAFYSPLSRFWELLIGCLLALHVRASPVSSAAEALRWGRTCASLGGMLLLLLSAGLTGDREGFPGFLALAPTVSTALLIWSGPSAIANRWLSRRGLVAIGLVSYPLYLWHWPLLSFAHLTSLGSTQPLVRAGIVAASFILAIATYHLVERPLRFGRWSRHGAAISTAGMTLACIASAGVYALDGLPMRMPAAIQATLDYQSYPFFDGARANRCFLYDTEHDIDELAPECFLDPERSLEGSFVLWGDSYAAGLYPGLRANIEKPRQLAQLTRSACAPSLDLGTESCRAHNANTIQAIRRTPPATVLMFAHWQDERSLWEPGSPAAASLAASLQAVSAAGVSKRVVLGPFPVWTRSLPLALYRYWNQHWSIPARMIARDAAADGRSEENLSRIAAQQGASFVSLIDLLCTAEGCLTSVPGTEGQLITWDHGHLTKAGASHVAKWLRERGALK